MTAEGTVVGTPDYMSPEQARGHRRSTSAPTSTRPASSSTRSSPGTLPFEGDTPLAVVLKHIQENPPSPQARNPKIDPKISQIILKCMQKDPKDRYQSVNELYEALTQVTAAGRVMTDSSRSPASCGSPLVLAALCGSAAARGPGRPQYFEEPAASRTSRSVGLPRALRPHRPPATTDPTSSRGRFEVRPEVDFDVSDRFASACAASSTTARRRTPTTRATSTTTSRAGAYVDRYYVAAGRPGAWTMRAGAFGMPLVASEMLWDHDIQTPGGAVSYRDRGPATLDAHVLGRRLLRPAEQGDQSRIGVGQVVWQHGRPALVLEAAARPSGTSIRTI